MGGDAKKDPPVFFTKPADAVVCCDDKETVGIAFPLGTQNLHYEGELVIALGKNGCKLNDHHEAEDLIFGLAVGCDLTRRDLQAAAKNSGGPWDAAKAFDQSAPIGPIGRVTDYPLGEVCKARLGLRVNGEERQNERLSAMIWSVPEIVITLSQLFELQAGDLIFTGTPSGVGPLNPGDEVRVEIGPLPPLAFSIKERRS